MGDTRTSSFTATFGLTVDVDGGAGPIGDQVGSKV